MLIVTRIPTGFTFKRQLWDIWFKRMEIPLLRKFRLFKYLYIVTYTLTSMEKINYYPFILLKLVPRISYIIINYSVFSGAEMREGMPIYLSARLSIYLSIHSI